MKSWMVGIVVMHIVCFNAALAQVPITGTVVTSVRDVGDHYPLFLVTKSYHPENVTVVYTKLDTHCRVLPDRAHGFMPTLDFYWLLNATRYQPMSGPIKSGVRKRLQLTDFPGQHVSSTSFAVYTDALSHVQHDLPNPSVQITSTRRGDACVATASLTLGPSNGYTTMQLESFDTKTEVITPFKLIQAMANPNSIQIEAVTVKGTDIVTGKPIKRTYHADP